MERHTGNGARRLDMIKTWADKILKWFCNPDYYPDIQGDIQELYNEHLENQPKWAQWRYLFDVILLFRPSLLRPIFKNSIINTAMIRNYFKISFRNLKKHKVYTFINVLGLAIGLSGFLLINQYVNFEKSYDRQHENAEQTYRVSTVEIIDGLVENKDAMGYYSSGELLENEIPEVVDHTVSKRVKGVILRNGPTVFNEPKVISADSKFLKFFNYQVLQGAQEKFFTEPNSVVLTKSKAKSYFGEDDALGKVLEMRAPFKAALKVTGVIEDIPVNTHYHFDILLSDPTLVAFDDYKNWSYNNYYVFLQLTQGTDHALLDEKMATLADKQFGEDNTSYFKLIQVPEIYLKSDYNYEPQILGSEKTVSFLGIISLFILVIAWVNYVNLATARAVDRAKEVGLRKVVGAFKHQLIFQFLFESFLMNVMGAVLALILTEIGLSYFNQLVGKEILASAWNFQPYLFGLLGFTLVGTLVSGVYPALVLSGFKPVAVLKGKFRNSKSGTNLRKMLVVVQFAASIILIAATFTVYNQVQYMKGRDLGISTDFVVTVNTPASGAETDEERDRYITRFKSFKNELRNHTAILAVGGTSNLPGGINADINATTNNMKIVGLTEFKRGTTFLQWNDDHFLEALDMELLAGRDFDFTIESDGRGVIANEAFLKKMNIADPNEVIGKKLHSGDSEDYNEYNIIGVVRNFNRTSLKTAVEPSLYMGWPNARKLVIKLQPEHYRQGLKHLESVWSEYFIDAPLEYSFLDERFNALYDQDQRFGNVFAVFAGFAILVATLGLFGLASFLSIQRTKEIGIRKVLGARIGEIIGVFYKDFVVLLVVAAILGVPIVYFGMTSWLENYAYRIDFPWLLALLSLFIVLLLSFLTVGYQTYKVATINPGRTLRYE